MFSDESTDLAASTAGSSSGLTTFLSDVATGFLSASITTGAGAFESVFAGSPADLSTAVQPLVADAQSGEAKYVSADAWFKAESAKGNL